MTKTANAAEVERDELGLSLLEDRDEWRDAAKALVPRLDAAEGEAYRLRLECDRLRAALQDILASHSELDSWDGLQRAKHIAREALKPRT